MKIFITQNNCNKVATKKVGNIMWKVSEDQDIITRKEHMDLILHELQWHGHATKKQWSNNISAKLRTMVSCEKLLHKDNEEEWKNYNGKLM